MGRKAATLYDLPLMFLFDNNGYIENDHRQFAEQCRNNNTHTAIHRGLAGQGWGVPMALDKAAGPCARFFARRAFLRVRALVTGEAAGEDSAVGAERTACFGDDWAGRDGEGGAGHSMIPIRQSP